MHASFVPLALLLLAPHQEAERPSPMLFAEHDVKYSFTKEGILELRGSRGWLRVPKVLLDFWLAFEFRTAAPETDAGVVFRSWTGRDGWPDRGYRFRLPTSAAPDATSLFEARRQDVSVIRQGSVDYSAATGWQKVEIAGAGREIAITFNDAVLGVFQVEGFGGQILLENRRGSVQLRNIRLVDRASAVGRSEGVISLEQLKNAGGQVPKIAREMRPPYTPDAMRRKVQGVVTLAVIILQDGSIGPIAVVRSLDSDLDESAIEALKTWKFTPGLLHGKPVAVLAEVEMTFQLK